MTEAARHFEVAKADLHKTRFVDDALGDLADGDVRLRVDTFGFTANNVTYAVFGDAMSYWSFFPSADPDWGRVPVWGFADVSESAHPDVPVGSRLYGYYPMSTHLDVTPAGVDDRGFFDGSAHRRDLPVVYNHYRFTSTDPLYEAGREGLHMLLSPLFVTGFMLDDFLADNEFFGASTIVFSSASARTTLSTAYLLRKRDAATLVGLTSASNLDRVKDRAAYDEVVGYEDVARIERAPTVYVDVAGDVDVRRSVHDHFGEDLRYSAIVGASHHEALFAPQIDIGGPRPALFFAPDQVRKRTSDWGRDGLDARIGDAWRGFAGWVDGWLDVNEASGPAAVERVYLEVLDGLSDPTVGNVLSLWPT